MADKIDMSLDDIIKSNKKTQVNKGRAGGNRGNAANGKPRTPGGNNTARNNGSGPVRSNNFNNNRQTNRRQSAPYSRPQQNGGQQNRGNGQMNRQTNGQLNRSAGQLNRSTGQQQQQNRPAGRWAHDKFDGPVSINTNKPGKLAISNLHYRVSDQDLTDLFQEFGKLKSANIFYDKAGRSLGNAQVVFASFLSAQNAKNKYNNILLDGRKMVINLEGEKPLSPPKPVMVEKSQTESRLKKPVKRLSNNQNRPRNLNGNNGNNRTQGGKLGGKPGQKSTPRKKPAPVTQEQLDADLDAYINKQN